MEDLICLLATVRTLKGDGPIFQNLVSVSFEESSPQRCKFQISVEMIKPFWCTKQFCILQMTIIV